MPSAHIITRVRLVDGRWVAPAPGQPRSLPRRYIVRYRLGGQSSKLRHHTSEATKAIAEEALAYVRHELAAGRIPERSPHARIERSPPLEAVARDWITSRRDVVERTRENYGWAVKRWPATMRARPALEVTTEDVLAWLAAMDRRDPPISASTIQADLGVLRNVLDHAGADPNPARDKRVRAPSYHKPEVWPPSAAEAIALLELLPDHWRACLIVMEGSGLRIEELVTLRGRDVDRAGGRLRVHRRRTKGGTAGQRLIPVGPAVMGWVPLAGPDERPFPIQPGSLRTQMRRKLAEAGMRRMVPHAFRHRWASRQVALGVPITLIRERMGHSRPSMTLDVYSHVLLDPADDPSRDLADLWHTGRIVAPEDASGQRRDAPVMHEEPERDEIREPKRESPIG